MQVKTRFWRAPGGRIHSLQRCSGSAPVNRLVMVRLTKDEFDAHPNRCRCARWPKQERKSS